MLLYVGLCFPPSDRQTQYFEQLPQFFENAAKIAKHLGINCVYTGDLKLKNVRWAQNKDNRLIPYIIGSCGVKQVSNLEKLIKLSSEKRYFLTVFYGSMKFL